MSPALAKERAHICYFSLNNEKEFHVMDEFTKKLNKLSPHKEIIVTEYLTAGDNPEESFLKMVKEGAQCDGLVISGHHTGSFGGKRSEGSLGIDFLERLSCHPQYKPWFANIKALWLQGCRTLGVGDVSATDTADFHTIRVGEVLTEDHLEQSFSDLNLEFSATLDQDNPLSSRFLRALPRAVLFGWTGTAPGKIAKSEYSLLYHIANMAKRMDDRGRYFDDPRKELSPKTAVTYMNNLFNLIKMDNTQKKTCGVLKAAQDSWIDHGHKKNRYAFDNADINAHAPLSLSDDIRLQHAKELDCILKEAKSKQEMMGALKLILKDEVSLGYSFNSVWGVVQRLKRQGKIAELAALQDQLKNSTVMQSFLMRKLSSNKLGIIRKIDYYAFYRDITGKDYPNVKKLILATGRKLLLKDPKDNYDLRDYQETLAQSLVKNKLLTEKFLFELTHDKKATQDTYILVSSMLKRVSDPPYKAMEIFSTIIESNKSSPVAMASLAKVIRDSSWASYNGALFLNAMLDSKHATGATLSSVIDTLSMGKFAIKQSDQLMERVLNDKKLTSETLSILVWALTSGSQDIPRSQDFLRKALQSPLVNSGTLGSLIHTLCMPGHKVDKPEELLKLAINSNKANNDVLNDIEKLVPESQLSAKVKEELLALAQKRKQKENKL